MVYKPIPVLLRRLNNAEIAHMFMNQVERSEYNRHSLINIVIFIRIMGLVINDEDIINYYYEELDEETNNKINKDAHERANRIIQHQNKP